jgi:hypothetical protein
MNDFCTWCEQQNIGPAMLEVMITCLLAWQDRQSLPPYFRRGGLATTAYDAQRLIGWSCFLEGSIAKSLLSPVQPAYLTSQGSQKTAKTWARGLVWQLWKVAFRMRGNTATSGNMMNPTLKLVANISSLTIRLSQLSIKVRSWS